MVEEDEIRVREPPDFACWIESSARVFTISKLGETDALSLADGLADGLSLGLWLGLSLGLTLADGL